MAYVRSVSTSCSNNEEVTHCQGDCYHHPAVRPPSLNHVAEIAKSLNINLTEEELQQYRDVMTTSVGSYQVLYELPEPKLPVKYPRTPGYRPSQQQNRLNAWSLRCDIPGAPSGKLHGKTIAIKDCIPVAGVPMSNGSQILEGFIPDIDATVVTRVLDHGARILGKATCEDLCRDGCSFTSANGPVRHPVDRSRMACGSSSGCAVLVANGEVDMAIGGDQGGSIRIPASVCGIVGLKPTFGLVPYTGIAMSELTLDHTGPMARTVYDTALLLESIAGSDEEGLDPRQPNNLKVPEYTKQLTGDIHGLRVGLVKEGFNCEFEQDVNEMVKTSAEKLRLVGSLVEEVSIPWHSIAKNILFGITEGVFKRNSIGDTSALMYYDTQLRQATARGLQIQANDCSPTVILNRFMSQYMSEDYYGIFYSKAQNLRRDLKKAYDEALQKYDVLIMPTCPKKAPTFPSKDSSIREIIDTAYSMNVNTCAANVTGHPAITVNAGLSQGLPVGMMIVGKMFDEATILNVAYSYEQLRDSMKLKSQSSMKNGHINGMCHF